MDPSEIVRLVHHYLKDFKTVGHTFIGVSYGPDIPKRIVNNSTLILLSEEPIKHCVSVHYVNEFTAEYFDPCGMPAHYYGQDIGNFVARFPYLESNPYQFQGEASNVCAVYSAMFVVCKSLGRSFESILRSFSETPIPPDLMMCFEIAKVPLKKEKDRTFECRVQIENSYYNVTTKYPNQFTTTGTSDNYICHLDMEPLVIVQLVNYILNNVKTECYTFGGVFYGSDIPKQISNNSTLILLSEEPIKHCVSVHVVNEFTAEYFDPFGMPADYYGQDIGNFVARFPNLESNPYPFQDKCSNVSTAYNAMFVMLKCLDRSFGSVLSYFLEPVVPDLMMCLEIAKVPLKDNIFSCKVVNENDFYEVHTQYPSQRVLKEPSVNCIPNTGDVSTRSSQKEVWSKAVSFNVGIEFLISLFGLCLSLALCLSLVIASELQSRALIKYPMNCVPKMVVGSIVFYIVNLIRFLCLVIVGIFYGQVELWLKFETFLNTVTYAIRKNFCGFDELASTFGMKSDWMFM